MSNPVVVLNASTRLLKATRFALGVAGIAGAVAIIGSFKLGWGVAFVGIVVMLVFMTVLVVFQQLAKQTNAITPIALVLGWSFTTITIATAVFLFSSAFFGWPRSLYEITHLNSIRSGSILHPGLEVPPEVTSALERLYAYQGFQSDTATSEGARDILVAIGLDRISMSGTAPLSDVSSTIGRWRITLWPQSYGKPNVYGIRYSPMGTEDWNAQATYQELVIPLRR